MSWEQRAACAPYPKAWFAPEEGNDPMLGAALTICGRCTERAACKASASYADRYYTVRGGEVPIVFAKRRTPEARARAAASKRRTRAAAVA